MVRFILSTCPLVHGCLGLVSRWSMWCWAQAYSKACAQTGSPASRAALMSGAAELVLPGVVKWVPLSVRTVGTFIGDGGEQATQEISGGPPRDFLMQFDEGELRRPVDGDDEMERALSGSDLGEVDMEIADRIGLELTLGRSLAFDLRQPGDLVALQTPVKGRA